jgi:hypothetical protein
MTHTPTPWSSYSTSDGTNRRHQIVSIGKTIAHIYCTKGNEDEDVANAAFIVKACNAHDELVAALEHARDKMWEYGFSEDDLQPIRAALSSIGGTGMSEPEQIKPSPEMHDLAHRALPERVKLGYEEMDAVLTAALSAYCVTSRMSTAEPVSDREAIGKAIYLAMYQHKGGLWEANEAKEVWYEIADRFFDLSNVQAPAPVAAPVQVKALEWSDVSEELERHRALGPIGPTYTVEDDGFTDGYHLTASQLVLGNFPTIEAAKTAAQKDYECRILSALEPTIQKSVAHATLKTALAGKSI